MEPARDDDDILRLTRELDAARVEIARIEAENAALSRKTGGGSPARLPSPLPSPVATPERAGAAAYRTEDPRNHLEREIAAANALVANLSIENAILTSRATPKAWNRAVALRRVAVVVAVAGGVTGVWFETENLGLVIFAVVLCVLGWFIVGAIANTQPHGVNRRSSDIYPGAGTGL